jgi:hypothetical protein
MNLLHDLLLHGVLIRNVIVVHCGNLSFRSRKHCAICSSVPG